MAKIKNTKIKDTFGDRVLNVFVGAILLLWTIIVLYPIMYVIAASMSSSAAIEAGMVSLWPVKDASTGAFGISDEAFRFVLAYKQVWIGYRNSIFYTICDLIIQMTSTVLIAYPLSRRYYHCRGFVGMFFFMATRFSAGMIPTFILKCDLGLFDNIWAVIIGNSIAFGHVMMLRVAINSSVPNDLFDAAMIDGANHFHCIFNIVLPLTKATLSVLCLYTMVGQWNEFFTSMLFLRDANLYPLQLVLRPIMTAATSAGSVDVSGMNSSYQDQANGGLENVRYALIIISTAPVIILYSFVQKAFKGGVMMGSLKG